MRPRSTTSAIKNDVHFDKALADALARSNALHKSNTYSACGTYRATRELTPVPLDGPLGALELCADVMGQYSADGRKSDNHFVM